MTTNKPNVQRYDDMGCPEQICCVDIVRESDDGDYVLYEDYEAMQAELEALRRDAEIGKLVRLKMTSGNSVPVERCIITAAEIAAIAQQEPSHDNQ